MKTGIPKEIEIKENRVICTPGGARMFVPQGHEVFVGIAIDQGGCAEAARHTTHDDPIFLKQEVIHYCGTIVPGAYACTATQALTNATVPYAMKLANVGAERAGIYARPAHGLEHLPGQGGSSRRRRGSRSAFVAESISARTVPMKSFRLKRLFNVSSGRCFDVAVDHGFFNQPGFLDGIEDMERTVRTIVAAAPDAIQLTLGMARHLQEIPGRNKPSLVLRTDVANIYGKTLPENRRFSLMIEDAMLQAVRHDAVCVCVNLFQIPGAPEVHAECVQNILRLKPQSDHYGMPMMIEPLVFRPAGENGGYSVNGDATAIKHLVRQAVELGADVIKADPTDDLAVYHKIVEVASGIPVLVRGGGRVSDESLLKRTKALMDQGAAGIVYGRNVVQHPNPNGITRALMAIVHGNASVKKALAMI